VPRGDILVAMQAAGGGAVHAGNCLLLQGLGVCKRSKVEALSL
jgi:hypothetical protein